MILTTLLSLTVVSTPIADASEFFPLVPGTKWEYREEGKFAAKSYLDEVLPAVEIGGEKAHPIQTSESGHPLDKVYYRATGDSVFIVAYDEKKPLSSPRPLFQLGGNRGKWEYRGTTPFYEDLVPLEVKGESSVKGKRKVLGKDVECLEVKFEARLLAAPGMAFQSNQTAIYAKGIGLIEMHEKTTVDRKSEERKLKLVSFTPAK